MSVFKLVAGVALATFMNVSASCAAVFGFSFLPVIGTITASGTLTTDSASPYENVVGISGQINGISISALDPGGFNILDPVLLAANFSFTDANGGDYVIATLFTAPFAIAISDNDNAFGFLEIVPDSISPVPLPASLPMFGTALLGLSVAGYGMKRKSGATATPDHTT